MATLTRFIRAAFVGSLAVSACGGTTAPATSSPAAVATTVVASAYPRTVVDAFGGTTTIARADHLVAAIPSVSDAVFGLGEGRRVVGRTKEAEWPPDEIGAVKSIGSYSALDPEALVGLGADLVVVVDWASSFEKNLGILRQLRSAGVSVLVVPELKLAEREGAYTLAVLEETVRLVADALAVPDRGRELVGRMRADADAARTLAAARACKPRVLSMLPYTPGSTRVTGSMKTEDLVIRLAGGVNVGAELVTGEKEVTPEDIVRARPDVIVVPESIWKGAPDPVAYLLRTAGVAETPAGKARRFVTWPDVPTHRASWRLPSAARELAEKLQRDCT